MNSMSVALHGVQVPRVRVVPRWQISQGEDAVFLSQSYGLVPDEWQSLAVDDILAVRGDDRWVCSRFGVSVPRQNGKNGVVEIVELYKMVVLGRRILHTAHEVKTARKAFLRLASFFENERRYPELAAMVREVRRTNGQEAIFLHTAECERGPRCGCKDGPSCEFIARSKGSGRGFTVDDLVLDEAQELDDFAYAALLPTISAAPSGRPQQLIVGTPPGPRDNGEVFSRLRADALSGKAARTGWLEWSFDRDASPDDRIQWARANPALGTRLGVEVVEDERAAMDDATFLRERGGVWASEAGTRAVIDDTTWADLFDVDSQPVDRLAMSVDMAPEGAAASIGVAGVRADDRWHVELIEQRAGSAWVVERAALVAKRHGFGACVIDGASPAMALVEPLRAAGVTVTVTGARDMGQACGSFFRLAMEDGLRHVGQPQLGTSVSVARKRAIGSEGLWGWGRAVSGADISPVVTVTLALWGAMSSTAKQQTRKRTGRAVFRG